MNSTNLENASKLEHNTLKTPIIEHTSNLDNIPNTKNPGITTTNTIVIKVRYTIGNKPTSRRILIDKSVKIFDFNRKLKEAFSINPDDELEIHYYDEANERIVVTSDDDIYVALNHNDNGVYKFTTTFEINNVNADVDDDSKTDEDDNNKTKNIKNDFKSENSENKEKSLEEDTNIKESDTEEDQGNLIKKKTPTPTIINFPEEIKIYYKVMYPEPYAGRFGDYNQITFESEDLVTSRVGRVYGTKIYTGDSDRLGAFLHMFPFVKLTNTPPGYDIIAIVQVLPDQPLYKGSLSNGIRSESYGYRYSTSFTFKTFAIREREPPTRKSKKRKIK